LLLGGLWLLSLTGACSKPKPPELTPRAVQVSALRPDGVELALQLNAKNPNSFPIVCNAVTGSFELQDGTVLGTGNSASAFTIPAGGDANIAAALQIKWQSLSALSPYALSGKALPYRLRGSAQIGGEHLNVDVPYSIEGQLTQQQVMAAGLRGAASFLNSK